MCTRGEGQPTLLQLRHQLLPALEADTNHAVHVKGDLRYNVLPGGHGLGGLGGGVACAQSCTSRKQSPLISAIHTLAG